MDLISSQNDKISGYVNLYVWGIHWTRDKDKRMGEK